MNPLNEKVVLITGASSGIGKAAAYAFAAHKAHLVLVARRVELLTELKHDLAREGLSVLAIPTDLVRENDLQTLCQTVLQHFGGVDVLVNNAGVSLGGAFPQQDPEAIRKMIDINVYAPMRLTQLILPSMLERKQGHIVNVSSMAGLLPIPGQTTYAPTRSAMIAFSQALRREIAGSGVRISTILPGWTRTAMVENMNFEALRAAKVLTSWMTFDDPAVPARAIVNAVLYNRDQTQMGGFQFWMGELLNRFSPKLMDWSLRRFTDTDQMIQAMKEFG
jgi:short-subunit dehydrogenase